MESSVRQTTNHKWIPGILGTAVFIAVGVLMVHAPPAFSQGLSLDTAIEKETDDLDRANPHFELECGECHEGKPVPNVDTCATVKFENGEKGNVDLCLTCHDLSDHIHPINVDPWRQRPPSISRRTSSPSRRTAPSKGTVVCSTCHFIHSKTAGLKLLRGFPESSDPEDIKKASFKDRRDLCRSCHGETLTGQEPAQGPADRGEQDLLLLPRRGAEAGRKPKFTKSLVELCDFCHAATKGGHFLLVNPFADPNLTDEIAKANLPMIGGEYTCVSCHNPHGGTGEEKFLRKEFVAARAQVRARAPALHEGLLRGLPHRAPEGRQGPARGPAALRDPAARRVTRTRCATAATSPGSPRRTPTRSSR